MNLTDGDVAWTLNVFGAMFHEFATGVFGWSPPDETADRCLVFREVLAWVDDHSGHPAEPGPEWEAEVNGLAAALRLSNRAEWWPYFTVLVVSEDQADDGMRLDRGPVDRLAETGYDPAWVASRFDADGFPEPMFVVLWHKKVPLERLRKAYAARSGFSKSLGWR